jgi:hypothetical protein
MSAATMSDMTPSACKLGTSGKSTRLPRGLAVDRRVGGQPGASGSIDTVPAPSKEGTFQRQYRTADRAIAALTVRAGLRRESGVSS